MRIWIVFLLCLVVSRNVEGQEGEYRIILNGQPSNPPQQLLAVPTVRALNAPYATNYVSWSYANQNVELIDYLASDHTRKQLEFSDEQNKEFKKLQQEFSEAFRDLYAGYPELKQKDLPNEARKVLNKKVHLASQKLRKEFSEKVKEKLIPQQVSMIRSLRFKQTAQAFGLSYALSNAPYAEELKTTDAQKKEIAKIKKEAEQEIQKMMAEIKAKAKSKMLKVLDKKQREKVKELEGEDAKPTRL